MAGITRYELLTAADTQELSRRVNDRIRAGWEPFGSPLAQGGDLLQAIVLAGDKEKRIRKTSED